MPDPVVFLHGLLCDQRLFAAQAAVLAGVTELSFPELTQDSTIAAMAERVLARAPPRFTLAGLSMGGYVAFEVLRQAPERVTRLALLDTQARADTEKAKARRRGLMQLAEKGRFQGVGARLLPLFLHPDRLDEAELTGTVQAMARDTGKEAFLRQQTAIMGRPDSRPDLAAIACPTLVLAGREDAITPPDRQLEMAHAIPDATLVLLPRCGHLAPLERPEEVTAQLTVWLHG